MGKEFDNTNSGALFTNDRKETDKHPDFNGSLNVGGVDYWISGWKKKSNAGKNFVSLSVSPKNGAAKGGNQRKPAPKQEDDDFI